MIQPDPVLADINQPSSTAQGSALDQSLVAINQWAQGYRDLSRQNLDNSGSPGMAAVNAGIYAINSVSSAVVGGLAQTGRILTNADARQQLAQGIGTLVTTDPRTTAAAAWDHWSGLSTEDQLIQGASVLVTLGGSAASKAGALETLAADVDEAAPTFVNQLPKNLPDELETAKGLGVSPAKFGDATFDQYINDGPVKYAVTPSGDVIVAPYSVDGVEISHAVLNNGQPVLAAGVADVSAAGDGTYFGLRIDTQSGHYLYGASAAQDAAAQAAARSAFQRIGITFP